jgi:hypothetical protein
MMLWMLYATCIAALLGLAAAVLEPTLAAAGRPTRVLWLAALLAGAGVGLGGPLIASVASSRAPEATAPQVAMASDPDRASGSAAGTSSATRLSVTSARVRAADRPLAAAWALTSALLFAGLLISGVRLRGLKSAGRMRRLRGVHLLLHPDRGPTAAGVLAPWVLLPSWARSLPARQRRLLLAHELEHVRGRDPLTRLAGTCVVLLMPWNAAAWWLLRRLRLAIEIDCDARVVRRCGGVGDYARFLLDVAAHARRVPVLALGEVSLSGNLESRVLAMTNRTRVQGIRLAVRAAVAALAIAGVRIVEVPAAPALAQPAPAELATAEIAVAAPQQQPAIAGTVVDHTGAPISGARIEVVGTALGAVTNTQGRFLLLNLPPGTHTLQVTAQGYGSEAVRDVALTAGRITQLTITLARPGEPSLEAAMQHVEAAARARDRAPAPERSLVTGQVTASDGRVLRGVQVRVAGAALGSVTNEQGRFLLLLGSPGTYSLTISLEGYRTVVLDDVRVVAGEPRRIEVVLEPEGDSSPTTQPRDPAAAASRLG